MVKLCSAKLLVTFGGLGLSLATGVGVASASPDLGPILNTTCSYRQVVAALQTKAPDIANGLTADPKAQAGLRQFLALSPDQRRQYVNGSPAPLPDIPPALVDAMSTCSTY
jgi:hemophore-related protein